MSADAANAIGAAACAVLAVWLVVRAIERGRG